MRFGTECPEGFLPAFSVGSESEAEQLLTLACHTDRESGEYIAEELQTEQTLDKLEAFGDRFREIHDKHFLGTEICECQGLKEKT